MSLPLKDFRVGITEAVAAALEAEAIAFDSDMQTVARQILEEWARRKHRAYTVYARRVLANGMQMELTGLEREQGVSPAGDAGAPRKGRRS